LGDFHPKRFLGAYPGCFDRLTGEAVPQESLKTYEEALAQYHLHPEAKFRNGDYVDRGPTSRRHVLATSLEHIGKEANRWEEQFHLGLDVAAQTKYGPSSQGRHRVLNALVQAGKRFGQRKLKLAEAADISLSEVSAVLRGKRKPTPTTLAKLCRAAPQLEAVYREQAVYTRVVLDAVRECRQNSSIRQFAERSGVDGANLTHVLNGRRNPSREMLAKLEAALSSE
jgi:transcriptional regulator with XRE-family HTH domain